ncbi:MAG: NAD(P)-dependent oxidoreductase [Muribaculaceae bacterium]|nr:NAD(P)-dependent oxidoreductase [Muribaculaceae bacterium]
MKVFMTGATGTMGFETLRALLALDKVPDITILVRETKKNLRKLKEYIDHPKVNFLFGDLRDRNIINRGVAQTDLILHIGGMVSPKADYHPKTTLEVNTVAMKNIVEAAKKRPSDNRPAVVYIGSVSQYGPRQADSHWCRTGDPMIPANHDMYALSKIKAERILAESGLKKWVSLRQTGLLYPELLFNGTDPITFHVPLQGVLEWTTVQESAALMANLCDAFKSLPDSFWRKFYNIGSGQAFRLTNYEFEKQLMNALSCPPPEKVFNTNWFATRNFHGAWFSDSDELERVIPFRSGTTPEEYFSFMASRLPGYFKLAGIVPAPLIKWGMKKVAKKSGLGPLSWFKDGNEIKIASYFKSREDYKKIPDWNDMDLSTPSYEPTFMNHGYDESKPLESLDLADMKQAAEFRGGKCLSEEMTPGDLYTPLEWECSFGHRFKASPATILLGGHWCEDCLANSENYPAEAARNPFMAQAWLSTHSEDEQSLS